MKSILNIKKLFFLNTLIFLFSLSYFGLTGVVTLQKILSLKLIDDSVNIYDKKFSNFSDSELSDFIERIPYRENEHLPILYRGGDKGNSWCVLPKTRYEISILNGNGNCSNFVFGAMYEFNNLQKQASVWHLLPNDSSFLKAFGHTVLQINIDGVDTVVDIFEGGVPLKNGEVINALNFSTNSSDVFSHQSLSSLKDNKNKYFTNNFLSKITFGVIPQDEIEDYFSFLESIYFSFGSKYLEKFFFDGVAIFFGKFPNTYVPKEFLFNTFDKIKLQVVIAYLALLSFHLFYVTLFVLTVKIAIHRMRKPKMMQKVQ